MVKVYFKPEEFSNEKSGKVGDAFMSASEVEAWLKIDVKTRYRYADLKIIPHLRIQGTVRFPARELQRWVERHSHVPREMNGNSTRARTRAKHALRARIK